MNNTNHKAIILIDKFHSGKASSEEVAKLNEWRNSSASNSNLYNEFISLLEMINGLRDWKQFDKKKAWSRLQTRMGAKRLRISRQIMAVAAIALFVLAATIWNFSGSSNGVSLSYLSGSEAKFSVLEDGSELFLNSDAKIYTDNFSDDSRFLRTQGSYFVNVKRDESSPFTLETERISIQVLGTSFKVQESPEKTVVKVREGKVLITSYDGATYTLRQNEQFEVIGKKVSISKVENEDWGLHTKSYEDESLFNLINDLSTVYGNLKINASNLDPACKITTKIGQSTIIEILEELDLIFDVEYSIKDGIIIVESISC